MALSRSPIARAHAAWDQNRRWGKEDRSFEGAVRAELPFATRCAALAPAVSNVFEGFRAASPAGNATAVLEYVAARVP